VIRAGRLPRPAAGLQALVALSLASGLGAQTPSGAGEQSRALARAAQAAQAGRADEAREILVELLAAAPGSSTGLSALFQLLAARGRTEEVLPWAERAVERSGPDGTVAMQVWIRTLSATGRADSAVAAAGRWVVERPAERAPRSALAEALAGAGDIEGAVEALRRGRQAAADTTAYAQELSALLASLGRYDDAAAEWRTMLAWGEPGVAAVADRITSPDASREEAAEALRRLLARAPATFAARRGGLFLALRLGEPVWARELAEALARDAPAESRLLVLRDYYVETRNRGWLDEAEWAATRLEREAETEPERRHWRAMRADLAFLRGDGEQAAPAFEELAAAAEPGTETHRRSLRRLFTIRTGEGDPRAGRLLEAYAASYPEDAVGRVEMAVELSAARIGAGDLEGAERVLAPAAAPAAHDASLAARLEAQRGVLALLRGRPGLARSHLETAAFVPGGDPVRRTDALLLVDALGRADSVDAARLGAGLLALAARRDPVPLLESAAAWTDGAAAGAGPSLVAIAAGALQREGYREEGHRVRSMLVESWPTAPETPGALLELGRSAAATGRRDEAGRWLERLIVSFPDHALAPIARRELADLEAEGTAVPGGGRG
jgi:tetratricopeptide (TPR) repeat protein